MLVRAIRSCMLVKAIRGGILQSSEGNGHCVIMALSGLLCYFTTKC